MPFLQSESHFTPIKDDASHQNLRDLALLLAVYCTRNTIIEDYHAAGQLSDPQMRAFNIEVSDKLYTALRLLLDPELAPKRDAFFSLLAPLYPTGWNPPRLDDRLLRALEKVADRTGGAPESHR